MIACAYEDRESHLLGVKLLVCSLARCTPDLPLHLNYPVPGGEMRQWLSGYPQVTLDSDRLTEARGWDVKPSLLLRLLDEGHDEVVWIDTDIILTRDFRPLSRDDGAFLVAEEDAWNASKGCSMRTEGWGLALGRRLPHLPNTGVIRVRPAHRALLLAWRRLMATPEYRLAQERPIEQRPLHMLTDQDVLAALLGSAEFSHVPLEFLRRGKQIIQHESPHSYAPVDRIFNLLRGTPAFVHRQGDKPWLYKQVPKIWPSPGRYYRFLAVESSPYSHFARAYAAKLGGQPDCLKIRSRPGKIADCVSLGNPHLRGFGQSVVASIHEWARHAVRVARRAPSKLARMLYASR